MSFLFVGREVFFCPLNVVYFIDMMRYIDHTKMGTSELGWLHSRFHFSFADYYNPANIHFGVLRVLNDDVIEPQTGFDTHPHRDMEIISYVVEGEITHRDSMGHSSTLGRGDVQYMSAGSGVFHSEHNLGESPLRLLQIWIFPDAKGVAPQYGEFRFPWGDRVGKWMHMVGGRASSAPIRIHQDANLFATALGQGEESFLEVNSKRQCYLVQIEGKSEIHGSAGNIALFEGDALEITEESVSIRAMHPSHFLAIEMPL